MFREPEGACHWYCTVEQPHVWSVLERGAESRNCEMGEFLGAWRHGDNSNTYCEFCVFMPLTLLFKWYKTFLGGIYFTKHLKESHREYVMVDLLVWIHQGNNKKHLKTFWKRTISTKQNPILKILTLCCAHSLLNSLQLYPLLVGWKGFQVCNKLIIPFTSQSLYTA